MRITAKCDLPGEDRLSLDPQRITLYVSGSVPGGAGALSAASDGRPVAELTARIATRSRVLPQEHQRHGIGSAPGMALAVAIVSPVLGETPAARELAALPGAAELVQDLAVKIMRDYLGGKRGPTSADGTLEPSAAELAAELDARAAEAAAPDAEICARLGG